MQTKICESCQQTRPLSEFRRTGKASDETSAWCMQCEERQSGRGSKRPPSGGEEAIKLPPD